MNAALTLWMVVFTQGPGGGSATGPAGAAPVDAGRPAIEAHGDCPSGAAVAAALSPVLGSVSFPVGAGAPRVSDLGDRFEASAAGQTGLYLDSGRDCSERARVAAVFIGLALNPPAFQSPPARLPAPAPKPEQHRWFEVGAVARVDVGWSGSAPAEVVTHWGGELDAAAGSGSLGAAVGAGMLGPTVSRFSHSGNSIAVRQWRFPFSAALRFQKELAWRVRLALEAGASLVVVSFRADGLAMASSQARLDAGLRGAVKLRLPPMARHVAPFLGLHAEYFPKPYDLDVDPIGTVGSSSRLWMGAVAGVVFQTF